MNLAGSGLPVAGSGVTARKNAAKYLGSFTKTNGTLIINKSMVSPPAGCRRATSDLGACSVSDAVGKPGAMEKRYVTGTARPSKIAALESSAASGVAWKLPAAQKPLACTAR